MGNNALSWDDRFRFKSVLLVQSVKGPRERISPTVAGTRFVRNREIKTGKEETPFGLSGIQTFSIL